MLVLASSASVKASQTALNQSLHSAAPSETHFKKPAMSEFTTSSGHPAPETRISLKISFKNSIASSGESSLERAAEKSSIPAISFGSSFKNPSKNAFLFSSAPSSAASRSEERRVGKE